MADKQFKDISSEGLKNFQDIRYGMFIHWGLYSLIGRGEWVMHQEKIPVPEYEKLAAQFNPVKFNADEWVSTAADAGMKYIVITSRHHDGFSMYDSHLTDYKITNTPFKRDPLKELADAVARRRDIKLGFYSSLLDWHHPGYRFRKETGKTWGDYIEFLHGQVRELCTNYGEIMSIWFDGDWPRSDVAGDNAYLKPGGEFEYEKLYNMIHTLQPNAVVHNNRHTEPLPGENIQGFEVDLPGQNSAGFNETKIYGLPIEVCMVLNDSWGFNSGDHNHKTTRRIINLLVRSASFGGNFLLNVGPTAEGTILPVHVKRLAAAGGWLAVNGESVYGTRAGVIAATAETVTTSKNGVHYVHILDDISDCIRLKGVPETISKAVLVKDGSPVKMDRKEDSLILTIPEERRDPYDTVVKLS
jgi:alpha-L-fucosidase